MSEDREQETEDMADPAYAAAVLDELAEARAALAEKDETIAGMQRKSDVDDFAFSTMNSRCVDAEQRAEAAEARVKEMEHQVAVQKKIAESERHYVDRLNICSDHRDKTTGRCVVCDGETRSRREAESSLAALRADYTDACHTIAKMHEAAMGEVCGPRRGVVEDVADLRAENERVRAVLKDMRDWCEQRRDAATITTLSMVQAKIDAVLQQPERTTP